MALDKKIQLLFFNHLIELQGKPLEVLNARGSIFRKIGGGSVQNFSQDQFDALQKGALNSEDDVFTATDGTQYAYDKNRIQSGYGLQYLSREEKERESIFQLILLEAIVFEAISRITLPLMEETLPTGLCDDQTLLDNAKHHIQNMDEELQKFAASSYLRPMLHTQKDENHKNRLDAAANVFMACQSQLDNGNVPEAYQERVYQLAEETANGLAGKFDSSKYNNIIANLPLERPWARIIVGAACVFAGLMLAAAAITLAVHSFGISTPLSALGIAVGVDLIMAGLAITTATASLAMAGTGAFFAGSKTTSEIADSGKDFSKKMGG